MSADYGTENFKGYHHARAGESWIHVVYREDGEHVLGDLNLGDIGELVQMAGQAWAGDGQVEADYVIQARHPDGRWTAFWSAPAARTSDGFAAAVYEAMAAAAPLLPTRLILRTIVPGIEVLAGEGKEDDGDQG